MTQDNVTSVSGKGMTHRQLKSLWRSNSRGLSLRRFAKQLVKEGNQLAQDWFDHKGGLLNQARSGPNETKANLSRQATKASRKKTKTSN